MSTIPPLEKIGLLVKKIPEEKENKNIDFWALFSPGSPEFARSFKIGLGSVSAISSVNASISLAMGKTDYFISSLGVSVLSLAGWYFAGQAEIHQNMQEKLDKMDKQIDQMEKQNLQQRVQLENYENLFKQFANDLTQFEKYSAENQDELAKIIQEFKDQLTSSKDLWDKVFKERLLATADQASFLTSLKKVVKDIKDASSALKQYEATKQINEDLRKTQQELDLTQGQIKEASDTLKQLKTAHQAILVRYEKATKQLENVNRDLAATVLVAQQGTLLT